MTVALTMVGMKGPRGERGKSFSDVKNELIKVCPTLRASPYHGDDTIAYTATIPGPDNAAIELSESVIDPATGRPMAKVTIPVGSTNYAGFDYLDLPSWQMQPNDVWMLAVYLPNRLDGGLNVQILVTDGASFTGVEYRNITFTADMLQQGFNLLTCLHVEQTVGAFTYGTVGTSKNNGWINNGAQTDASPSRSIRVRAKTISAQATATEVYFGSIHTAPAGWAKSAIMWMADDVPNSFWDLAVPVIESHGWKCALAIVSTYAASPGSTYMSTDSVREAHKNGHEIWGHLRRHEDMQAITTAQRTRALKSAAQFWRSIGINTAAQFMAWPFGRYNDEAITLAKSEKYRLAASIRGEEINPLIAGCNPYYLNRFAVEKENSWQVDSTINGAIKRGRGLLTYMHNAVAGGAGIDTYPAAISFYVDHLKRWCDLVAAHEAAGNCVVVTPLEYFRLCGISPDTHDFAE